MICFCRHIVGVTLKEDTQLHSAGTVVDALVYSGSISNPNFHFMPSGCRFESQGIETGTLVRQHSATADIIAAAVGPSGSNSDYLFNLDDYLHENGITDEYIYDLSAAVAQRMGPWRARPFNRYLKHTAKTLSLARDLSSSALLSTAAASSSTAAAVPSSSSTSSQSLVLQGSRSIIPTEYQGKENHFTAYLDTGYLIGWGSNEYLQLGTQTPLTHPDLLLQSASRPILLSRTSCDISTENTDSLKNSLSRSAMQSQESYLNEDISFCQVLCGGASSAFLGPLGDLTVWGKIAQSEKNSKNATGVVETENKKGAMVIQEAEGESTSAPITPLEDDSRLMFKDIVGAAIGHDHLLLLTSKGWVVPLGDSHWGQCEGPKSFVRMGSMNGKASSSSEGTGGAREGRVTGVSAEGDNASIGKSSAGSSGDEQTHLPTEEPKVQVLKLACGVRHSAAVTTEGFLHVWGSGSAASIVLPAHSNADAPACKGEAVNTAGAHHPNPVVPVTWRPDDAKLIDVSCGMEQTVTIDDRGRVWSFGSNKHGSLGRSVPSTTQESVPVNSDPNTRTVIENSSQENEKAKTRKVVEKDRTPRLVEGLEPNVRWQRVSKICLKNLKALMHDFDCHVQNLSG
jgi:alpha-tubulin suppressor-like RCC1 family protein